MMPLTRRKFLTLTASSVAAPALALPVDMATQWTGKAMGADVALNFHNTFGAARDDIDAVVSLLRSIEQRFSLYDPTSQLSRLNRQKSLAVDQEFLDLFALSKTVHNATGGTFDPTIQTLWEALAVGQSVSQARAQVGFDQVLAKGNVLHLGSHQSLSFNGIAQGYATDVIRTELATRGYNHVLINMGEYSAQGGPFVLGVQDPKHGQLGTVSLENMSVATSSPSAGQIRQQDHILHPKGGKALWSTVSVEAKSAAVADACSTAFCMMSRSDIKIVQHRFNLGRVLLVDHLGNMSTL